MQKRLLRTIEEAADARTGMDASMTTIDALLERLTTAVSTYDTRIIALLEQARSTPVNSKIIARIQNLHLAFNTQYLQLQMHMQRENRTYTSVSNVLKTRHDTVKNSISNIR